jgi:response regulator of citrate/malate metabolism
MSQEMHLYPGSIPVSEGYKGDPQYWNFSVLDDLSIFEADKDILIVEDDVSTTKLFKVLIARFNENTRIKSLNSSEEARNFLCYLIEQGFDGPNVALIDYNLAGENGLLLCHLLDVYFPETKVVVVSALDPEDIKKQIREKRLAVDFVAKPVDQEKMVYILSGKM